MKLKKSTQRGAALVEYGMVLAIISATSVTVVSTVGDKVSAAFSNVNAVLSLQVPQGSTGSSDGSTTSSSASNNADNQPNGHHYAYGVGNGNAYAYGHSK